MDRSNYEYQTGVAEVVKLSRMGFGQAKHFCIISVNLSRDFIDTFGKIWDTHAFNEDDLKILKVEYLSNQESVIRIIQKSAVKIILNEKYISYEQGLTKWD